MSSGGETVERNSRKFKDIFLKAFGWFSVTAFALLSLAVFSQGRIAGGLCLLIAAVVCAPPLNARLRDRWAAVVEAEKGKPPARGIILFALYSFAWLAALFGIILVEPSVSEKKDQTILLADLSGALPYTVISSDDTSIYLRDRWRIHIGIEEKAPTQEQRAQTVVKAALDFQQEKAADVVAVFLEPHPSLSGQGMWLASATYIVDGKGLSGKDPGDVWSVSATETLPSRTDIAYLQAYGALEKTLFDTVESPAPQDWEKLEQQALDAAGLSKPYQPWLPIRSSFIVRG